MILWQLYITAVVAHILALVSLVEHIVSEEQQPPHQVLFRGPVNYHRRREGGGGEEKVPSLSSLSSSIINEQSKNRLSLKSQQQEHQHQQQQQQQKINLVKGDENGLYLVGLFDIHHSNARVPSIKCGPIDIDAGEWQTRRSIQNLEAFLWAIEQVNSDKQLLPGIKLGSLVLDTCSSFLRTNQQLANLLHQEQQQQQLSSEQLPNVRQLMAIVADNQDSSSVEAVASMSSALGLATFVTQSRSTKLAELARRYSLSSSSSSIMNVPPQLIPGESPLQTASSGGGDKQFEGLLGELMGIGKLLPTDMNLTTATATMMTQEAQDAQKQQQQQQQQSSNININQQEQQQQQRLYMIRMLLGNELLADALVSLCQQMNWDLVSLIYDDELDMIDLHDELARQLFARNIQLALDEQISMKSSPDSYNKLLHRLASKTQMGSRVVITLLGTGSARLLLDSFVNLRNQAASSKSPQQQTTSSQQDSKLLARQANSLLWLTISDREPYYSLAINALGSVVISNSVSLIPEFKNYYDNLKSDQKHVSQNRWWPEYMESILLRHQKDGIELISNECAKWQEPQASLLPERCRSLSLNDLVKIQQLHTNLNLQKSTNDANKNNNNNNNSINNKAGKQQQQQQPKLGKYLAGGWEHNGMDVINSVLAIANGLESVRQTLCPGKLEGICDEMRHFISAPLQQQQQSTDDEQSNVASAAAAASTEQTTLPMMSELIYNELLRSTFQLADGRLFNLIEADGQASPFSPSSSSSSSSGGLGGSGAGLTAVGDNNNGGGHQLDGKLKLFNLRYLQPNSIGFVKFGTFDRQDGLIINSSKALHYSPIENSVHPSAMTGATTKKSLPLKAIPLEQIKSTCEDSSKCLMLSQFLAPSAGDEHFLFTAQANGENNNLTTTTTGGKIKVQHISEEELASGLNSLFKLDHPAIVSGQQQQQHQQQQRQDKQTSTKDLSSSGSGAGLSKQQQRELADKQEKEEQEEQGEGEIREIRLQPPISDHFNWRPPTMEDDGDTSSQAQLQLQQQQQQVRKKLEEKRSFEVVVLLPLHKKALAGTNRSCSRQLNLDTSFQHLAAIAFAGQSLWMMNGRQPPTDTKNDSSSSSSSTKQMVELTTTVIDYCEQVDLAERKLSHHLLAHRRFQVDAAAAAKTSSSSPYHHQHRQVVAVIDFDENVSRRVENLVSSNNLLHLTVGSSTESPTTTTAARASLVSSTSKDMASGQSVRQSPPFSSKHLHLSLMPSKTNEIEAIISMISAMPSWKLVHLIYTDHHHYRDEFVRRANEANICVSKLIWIPHVSLDTTTTTSQDGDGSKRGGKGDYDSQLEKTRKLFIRELHDYRSSEKTAPDSQQQQQQQENEGLNSTKVLVVLASGLNKYTNKLILEASSESMLEDYVWLTSHEWLWSLPENDDDDDDDDDKRSSSSMGKKEKKEKKKKKMDLPRYFVSTRFETSHESHEFGNFLTQLTPAIHRPLPTDWFDEFWQQKFTCRLPIAASAAAPYPSTSPSANATVDNIGSAAGAGAVATILQVQEPLPLCSPNYRLHMLNSRLDDRVHFVIRAITALQLALESSSSSSSAAASASASTKDSDRDGLFTQDSLIDNFREKFESIDRHESKPYGFQIIHRLLPPSPQHLNQVVTTNSDQNPSSGNNGRRRSNSRQLDGNESEQQQQQQLVRVGIWRNGELILASRLASASKFDSGQELPSWLQAEAAAAESDSNENDDDDQRQESNRMQKSLAKLESIESRCLNEKTCRLCEQQIEQTNKLIQLEEIRLLQSQSLAEPKAISSIDDYAAVAAAGRLRSSSSSSNKRTTSNNSGSSNKSTRKKSSILDSSPSSPIEFDADQSSQQSLTPAAAAVVTSNSSLPATDDIQAAASSSSLFNGAVKQQIQLEEQADLRRHFAEQSKFNINRQSSIVSPSSLPSLASKHHNPALFGVLLSLVGIICMLFTMTHLYPTVNYTSQQRRTKTKEKTTTTGSVYGSEMTLYYDEADSWRQQPQHQHQQLDSSCSNNEAHCQLANSINYFLLTGLLMLYSINVAFVLPTTMSVCWFRRIGLAISYTVIFSSILAQIMVYGTTPTTTKSTSTSSRRKKRKISQSMQQQQQRQAVHLEEDPAGGGGEESEVEVTFESLPPINEPMPNSDQIQANAYANGNDPPLSSSSGHETTTTDFFNHSLSGYQVRSSSSFAFGERPPITTADHNTANEDGGAKIVGGGGGGMALTIPISLILIQIVVSFVWLLEQPPEPTLYLSCWYCSSPTRSQTLFLYESLLSLIYPAFVLLLSWLSALVSYYHITNKNEEASASSNKQRLLVTAGDGGSRMIAQQLNSSGRYNFARYNNDNRDIDLQNDFKLRDSKCLIISTTLVILTWSIATLMMISSTNAKLFTNAGQGPSSSSASSSASSAFHTNKQQAFDCNTTILVYANIISGAIVFISLFLYRLNLPFHCNPMRWKIGFNRSNKLANKHNQNSSMSSFRSILSNHTAAAATGNVYDNSIDGHLFFTRTISEFTPQTMMSTTMEAAGANQHERLGLRQFNSYGTYNQGSQFDASVGAASAAAAAALDHRGVARKMEITTCDSDRDKLKYTPDQQTSKLKKRSKRLSKSSLLKAISGSVVGHNHSSSTEGMPVDNDLTKPDDSNKRKGSKKKTTMLQRNSSACSAASSTTKLVSSSGGMNDDGSHHHHYMGENDHDSVSVNGNDNDMFAGDDTISCASSIASSSTSQLHGNDLYPIDCSLQLDSQPTDATLNRSGFIRSSSFRRQSIRRSMNKLSSVSEEQIAANEQLQGWKT